MADTVGLVEIVDVSTKLGAVGILGILAWKLPSILSFVREDRNKLLENQLAANLASEDKCAKRVQDIVDSHRQTTKDMLDRFGNELEQERKESSIREDKNILRHESILESLKSTRHAADNIANAVLLHHAKLDEVLKLKRVYPDTLVDDENKAEKKG